MFQHEVFCSNSTTAKPSRAGDLSSWQTVLFCSLQAFYFNCYTFVYPFTLLHQFLVVLGFGFNDLID